MPTKLRSHAAAPSSASSLSHPKLLWSNCPRFVSRTNRRTALGLYLTEVIAIYRQAGKTRRGAAQGAPEPVKSTRDRVPPSGSN